MNPPLPSIGLDFESCRAALGGTEIHWIQAEAPTSTGRPLLLLHGWPQDHRLWLPLARELYGQRRILIPDLRGFGESLAGDASGGAATFVTDQIALLDHLGIEQVDVIGHDWGGWTALQVGLEHPDRVGSILACSTPHPWAQLRPATLDQLWRSWYALSLATPGLGSLLSRQRWFIEYALTTNTRAEAIPAEMARKYAQSLARPESAAAVSALYRYYLRSFVNVVRGRWSRRELNVPTLLLYGSADRYISPRVIRVEPEHRPGNLELEEVQGAGHFLVDERPGLVLERARLHFGDLIHSS